MVWCQTTGGRHEEVYVQVILQFATECTQDSAKVKAYSWGIATFAILLIPLLVWLYRETRAKEVRIKQSSGQPYLETYCTVSLQLIQLTKASIIFHCLVLPMQAAIILLDGDEFKRLFFAPTFDGAYLKCGLYGKFFASFNWLIIWRLLAEVPLMVVLDLIFWVQTVEWMAMNNLIENQKHKTVQQILSEFHEENINQSLTQEKREIQQENSSFLRPEMKRQQRNYRRKEIRLKAVTQTLTVVLAISLFFLYSFFTVLRFKSLNNITVFVRTLIFLAQLFYFARLFFNMRRFHNYEFQRSKNNMIIQIVISGITQLFRGFYLVLGLFLHDDGNQPVTTDCQRFELKHHGSEFDDFLAGSLISRLLILAIYVLYFENLVLDFAIARLKSSQDILQGVSKLDYLLKVSEFQRFKSLDELPQLPSVDSMESFQHEPSFAGSLVED